MAKISIETEDLAKVITLHITGALLIIGHMKLSPSEIKDVKMAVKADLDHKTYLQAAATYDQMVFEYN